MAAIPKRLRLAELLASLSLATDLGTGQPMGHGLRTCLRSLAIGDAMGCSDTQLRTLYQVALLRFLGCTADAAETAEMVGGDELTFNAAMSPTLNGSATEGLRAIVGSVGRAENLARRGRMVTRAILDTTATVEGLRAHCEVATMLASRLRLAESVLIALGNAYERWDGKGFPNGIAGDEIPLEIRICAVARDVDLAITSGVEPAEWLRRRRGRGYDPAVVDAYEGLPPGPVEAHWDRLIGAEPKPFVFIEMSTEVLTVLADFVDLKSPWTRGHSRNVAHLARAAAGEAKMSEEDATIVEWAGLVHDLGRIGVDNGIWDKPGPLSVDEWERVRLHPYLTSRILDRCDALVESAREAASHHERLDGSGYHTRAKSAQLSMRSRILAAADAMDAMLSSRPHRGPLSFDAAVAALKKETARGGLDGDAVACVVAAAGGASATISGSGLLTERERQVLREIASGSTNREVAEKLFISSKTVGRHVENIYAKAGVTTRAGAAVYAMEHGMLGASR